VAQKNSLQALKEEILKQQLEMKEECKQRGTPSFIKQAGKKVVITASLSVHP